MSSETEIKLDLSHEAFDALIGSDLLGEPAEVVQQSSVTSMPPIAGFGTMATPFAYGRWRPRERKR